MRSRWSAEPLSLSPDGYWPYTHSDHVRNVATNASLNVMRLDKLRMEYGVEVIGLFVLLRQEEGRFLYHHAAPVAHLR